MTTGHLLTFTHNDWIDYHNEQRRVKKDMTKKQMEQWKEESIKQALVRLTQERYMELQKVMKAAGEVH